MGFNAATSLYTHALFTISGTTARPFMGIYDLTSSEATQCNRISCWENTTNGGVNETYL
jgi:hypothetical protein